MRILKVTLGLALGALVLAAATFVVLPAVVQAQSATPAPQATPSAPGKPRRGFHSHGPDTLITAAASVTGLTTQEVMTDLQSGKSLAQIAEGKGKTADDVIKAARTQLDTQLKQAVTGGHLTQAQADAKLAEFDQTAPQIVSGTFPGPGFGPGRGFGHDGPPGFDRHGGPDPLIDATASVTGLATQEVVTDLQSGKSLAQIAEGKGKTADDIIKAARTQLDTQLQQAVTDGRLTQAQADAKLQQFDQTAPQVVSDTTLGQRLRGGPFNQPAPTPPAPANTSLDGNA